MIGYEYLSQQIWAIREENLKAILAIASRIDVELPLNAKKVDKEDLSNPNNSKVEGKVQVIDLIGPIVRHGDMFTQISGARSLSGLKNEFVAALNNEDVGAILFNIDSPGGEANGISEFADLVYNSRGKKPIVSYVGGLGCSAAYWIASATDKIYCSETATLGSIGCAAVIRDTDERDEREGVKNVQFVSSNSPNKRPDVKTEEGRGLIQAQVDAIGDIFIEKVARNRATEDRKLTFKNVVNKFNKGGVLIGKDAVDVGMADAVSSYDEVFYNLNDGSFESAEEKENINSMSTKDKKVDETISTEEVKVEETETTTAAETKDTSNEKFSSKLDQVDMQNLALAEEFKKLSARFQESEARNAKLENDILVAKAEAEAAKLEGKIVPAQKEAFVKGYVQAATDDKVNPVEGYSRLESFMSVYNALPSHNLTEDTMVLSNPTDEDEDISASVAVAEKYAESVNKVFKKA